ncbi:MAG: J domain-containing protein [Rickettsiales bacterium]|jgi:hypothetical protein|nr:J domain-containing protein [Rickettsiales bacterium]
MNREEALKILGFSEDANPSEKDIRKVYLELVLNVHSDKQAGKPIEVQKENLKRCQLVNPAYEFLTGKNAEEVTNLTNENLDEIRSPEYLKFYLYKALFNRDIASLKKLFFQVQKQ